MFLPPKSLYVDDECGSCVCECVCVYQMVLTDVPHLFHSFLCRFYLHYVDGLFLWYFVDNFQHLKCYLTTMIEGPHSAQIMMHSTVNFQTIYGITFKRSIYLSIHGAHTQKCVN